MKTQIKKNLRIIALIIAVALLSIFIATAFVACDENDENNNQTTSEYETLIEKMIAFGINTYACCRIKNFYGKDETLGEGSNGYISLFAEISRDEYVLCEIYDYENENFAKANIEQIKNNTNILTDDCEWNVFVYGSKIIIENENDLFNRIISYSNPLPSYIWTNKQKNFIKDTIYTISNLINLQESWCYLYLYNNFEYDNIRRTGIDFEGFTYLTDGYEEHYICGAVGDYADYHLSENALDCSYDKTEDNIKYFYEKRLSDRYE